MSHYSSLLTIAAETLSKYSLASLLETMDVETINAMMRKHRVRLEAIKSYEQGLVLANEILLKMSGFPVAISAFITKEQDMRSLYELMIKWRNSVFAADDKNTTV